MKHLEKRAKEVILAIMHERGEMTTTEIMNLIRPHYLFDALEAREQGIRRQANQLMKCLRDESGVRTCFAVKQEDTYINIDRCNDVNRVACVEDQLDQQILGLIASRNKATRRRKELEGQLSLDALTA